MVTAINSVSEIRKNAQYVVDMVGGEGIHPSDVRIGGMARNISEVARKRLYARLRALQPKVDAHVELIIGLVADKGFPEGLGVTNAPSMATHQLYGDRTKFDLDQIY